MTFDRTDWLLVAGMAILMGAPVAVVLRMLGL